MKDGGSKVWLKVALLGLMLAPLSGCSSESDAAEVGDPMAPVESTDPSDASDSSDAADPSGNASATDPSDASESSNTSEDPGDADGYDPCGDKNCGETCRVCPPDDSDCVETGVVKACDAIGECVADTGDLCDEADYVPCAGKTCGETCRNCDPEDEDCVETGELKACDPEGNCVSYREDLCDDDSYEPCANKSCGDSCTICAPGDDDCFETSEIKACDPAGNCVSDTGDLCDERYDPCAGKACGDSCTVCAPDDSDCFETDEMKACDSTGQCVSDTGDLCAQAGTLCERVNAGEDLIGALEWRGGCGDLTLYATKPDRTIELNLDIAGVCQEAHDGSAPLSRTYVLPDDAVSLGITSGVYVDAYTCNDAILYEPVIAETLVPISGTLELDVTPGAEAGSPGFPSTVSATLSDAVFVDSTGCSFAADLTWTNVYAGWLPGR